MDGNSFLAVTRAQIYQRGVEEHDKLCLPLHHMQCLHRMMVAGRPNAWVRSSSTPAIIMVEHDVQPIFVAYKRVRCDWAL